MYNNWYNMPAAYGAYGIWKRDAEADSEVSPGGTPTPAPMDGTACTTAGTTGLTPMDCGRGTPRLIPRPSPGGTPTPAPTDGTACTTTGPTCLLPMVPMESGRGTLRLIPRPSPGGTPMDGTACTTAC